MSQQIRWGILGTARIASRIATAIHRCDQASLQCIASRRLQDAQDWATQHQCPDFMEGYHQLISREDIDAIYIPLPPHLHHEWTLKAAEAGKHVLCEKPISLDVTEADEMKAACQQANVLLMDGTMWYHHPRTAQMKSDWKSAAIGEIQRMTVAVSHPLKSTVPDDQEYRLKHSQGGGSLRDLGWYAVGAIVSVFEGRPQRVWGTATMRKDIDESFSGWLDFGRGRVASFDCSFRLAARRWMEITGTNGSLVCDDFTRPWHEEKARYWIHGESGNLATCESETVNQELKMIEEFSSAIIHSRNLDSYIQRSLDTQYSIDQLWKSSTTGCIMDCSP